MTTKNTTIDPNKLQLALKIVGLAWASFYVIAAVSQQFFPIDPDSLMGLFFVWGHGGVAYVSIICAINIPLGLALYLSAANPGRHASAIDLCLVINFSHLICMLIMSFTHDNAMLHLAGDVPIGLIAMSVLAYCWLPLRSRLINEYINGASADPA